MDVRFADGGRGHHRFRFHIALTVEHGQRTTTVVAVLRILTILPDPLTTQIGELTT